MGACDRQVDFGALPDRADSVTVKIFEEAGAALPNVQIQCSGYFRATSLGLDHPEKNLKS